MEHETTPNRQISRSRFVSPFCACFHDKNVFDPPSAGTPTNGNAACQLSPLAEPVPTQRHRSPKTAGGGAAESRALSFRVIPLFSTIIGFLLTYIASCDGHRNPSSPGGRRPEASHSLCKSIGWMTL